MKNFKTIQENFWAGEFGDEYITRNSSIEDIKFALYKWKKMTANIHDLKSCIEFGSNIGNNLLILERLFPSISKKAIEINQKACAELEKIPHTEVVNTSILEYTPNATFDLSFTCGVLIHINPDELKTVYQKLFESSHKYILLAEYYSLKPEEISYRGHEKYLFKRDFADELLKQYPQLSLVDYGFFYHNDTNCLEDTNWFLFKK